MTVNDLQNCTAENIYDENNEIIGYTVCANEGYLIRSPKNKYKSVRIFPVNYPWESVEIISEAELSNR